MFPYIDTSHWQFLQIAALVPVAIAVGYPIATWRAQRSGIGREQFSKLGLCVVAAALLGGHLAKFVYSPTGFRIISFRPLLLVDILNGQASFGAFIGGFFAAQLFLWRQKIPFRDWYLYADAAAFAVPLSWWIGRLGCYLAHDHPGIRTTSWLGVRYPGGTRTTWVCSKCCSCWCWGPFFCCSTASRGRAVFFTSPFC